MRHPINVPGLGVFADRQPSSHGFQLGQSVLLTRVGIATAYVAFGFTALLALGTFFSILTDTSASAIGATIGVYIVSEILDGISQLGRIRYFFPTHYLDAWQSMFTDNRYSHDMVTGHHLATRLSRRVRHARDRLVPPQGHSLLNRRDPERGIRSNRAINVRDSRLSARRSRVSLYTAKHIRPRSEQ